MQRIRFTKGLILAIFCVLPILFAPLASLEEQDAGNVNTPNPAADLSFLEEFKASQYYLSPETSWGQNDQVFFTFKLSKDGNYTITVSNAPARTTDTTSMEGGVSFDNPSGTQSWYYAYTELDDIKRGNHAVKLLTSHDLGKTWSVSTVATWQGQGETVWDVFQYVQGTAMAANPTTGVITTATWVNASDLFFMGSISNGSSWNIPVKISDFATLGYNAADFGYYPKIEAGILPNGTIVVFSEINSTGCPQYTPIVYFESHDNGTIWSSPQNVTCIKTPQAYKPKFTADFSSGKYWLMWRAINGSAYNNRWAEFNSTKNLNNATVAVKNVSLEMIGNYDFIYDLNGKFRLFEITQTGPTNTLWTCDGFSSPWVPKPIEPYIEELDGFSDSSGEDDMTKLQAEFCLAFDGHTNHFFYAGEKESGEDMMDDLYHYTYVENSTFWVTIGNFTENTLMQVPWNGKINNTIPINGTRVKVQFQGENDTLNGYVDVESVIYLNLDNVFPAFKRFQQKDLYFNPLSQNVTVTEVNWDVAPSEAAYYRLEVFQNESQVSPWRAVTANNFNEASEPLKIFSSTTGQLYIIYLTFVEGLQVVSLIRSADGGVSWTTPVTIVENAGSVYEIAAAAYGDIVVAFIKLDEGGTNVKKLYRSFDQGSSFEQPHVLPDMLFPVDDWCKIESCAFSNNGTLFTGYLKPEDGVLGEFHILESLDLGLTWGESQMWYLDPSFNRTEDSPVLLSDPYNDLIHVCLPQSNASGVLSGPEEYLVSNYSFSTLNMTTHTWSALSSAGIYPIGPFTATGQFLLLRENQSAPITLKLIYLKDVLSEPVMDIVYEEIISTDLGLTWSAPQASTLDNMTVATTQIGVIYYANIASDGNDQEVYLSREGKLVCVRQESIPHSQITEISFDGKTDGGEYLPGGNYSYTLALVDYARNRQQKTGWFYIDYDAPIVTNPFVNWSNLAIPLYDVNVSIHINDAIGFGVWLHYRRNNGMWQVIGMIPCGTEQDPTFYQVIPGDVMTSSVQYFITAKDYAQNEFGIPNSEYHTPSYSWVATGLFNMTASYSSSQDYSFTINVTKDIQFVDEIVFRYTFDGTSWNDLVLTASGTSFTGNLADLPGDLKQLQYQIIVVDKFGRETPILVLQLIPFYPELPKMVFTPLELALVLMTSTIIGLVVAVGYVKLKRTSHEGITRQIFATHTLPADTKGREVPLDIAQSKIPFEGKSPPGIKDTGETPRSPFTFAYVSVFIATVVLLLMGMFFAEFSTEIRILILAASLLVGIFCFMILMSRDISQDIYLEKFQVSNVFLEIVQVGILLYVIINILEVGYLIPWFRYYMIDSTYDFAGLTIPKLYVSILGVFFTSLVLVLASTYIELRRTVSKLGQQRVDGGITGSALLYLKEENTSRLISNMGIKTVVFLVTVLITIITTTDLLNTENMIALAAIAGPFAITSFLVLSLHPIISTRKKKLQAAVNIPFIEAEKACTKCGTNNFLSSKFCKACGTKLVFTQIVGQYVGRCAQCHGLLLKDVTFCTTCGIQVSEQKPSK